MEQRSFNQFNISDKILRAIRDMGFEEPTSIQHQTIPLILEGDDVIGHSQTGTGKTVAFGIPMIELMDSALKAPQALVLCPTRELAIQVCEELRKLTKFNHGVGVIPIYGGQPIDRQIKLLKNKPAIVVGTPGRIMDHLDRKTLRLDNLALVVLDEADEMLNMGFRPNIERILKDAPASRQTVLFSATMPKAILEITKRYQRDPKIVEIERHKLTAPQISQYRYEVPSGNKIDALANLLDYLDPKVAIVFCNTKRKADKVARQLDNRGYSVGKIHGDISQNARTRVMKAFKAGKIDILVATDVAARGIDVDDVDAVINFDIPLEGESYVHRIGRTGRAGKKGSSHTLVVGRTEAAALKEIERHTDSRIFEGTIPSISRMAKVADDRFSIAITQVLKGDAFRQQKPLVEALTEAGFSSIDIACAALQMASESQSAPSSAKSAQDDRKASDSGSKKKSSSANRKSSSASQPKANRTHRSASPKTKSVPRRKPARNS